MESIANYKIEQTIAINGPSAIYIASHKKLGRKTFLKVYQGDDKALIKRFEREAKIVAELNNDAIVQIYDFGEADGKFFISMEYVDGSNLADFLKQHLLDWEQCYSISLQITRALSILHKKGYIHRDLKPENILVGSNLKVKLTDFGLSLHESLSRETSDGALLGTPLYMSPEQINNLKLGTSSDMFSLGIIFYQLATGKHPFEAPQYAQVFSRILTEEPVAINKINHDIPDWFSNLVLLLLTKNARDRIQQATGALDLFYKNSDAVPLEPENQPSKTRSLLVLFFVLIALGASLFYILKEYWIPISPVQITIDSSQTDSLLTIPAERVANSGNDNLRVHQDQQSSPNPNPNLKDASSITIPTTLLIKSFPWSNIYLNYEFVDKTPMINALTIEPGEYVLGLQNPAYPSLTRKIVIKAHEQNEFVFHLDSSFICLNIQVIPWGKIFIDGKYITTTPVQEPIYLTKENHFIEIKNDYFRTWSDSIRWTGNQKIQMSVELTEKI